MKYRPLWARADGADIRTERKRECREDSAISAPAATVVQRVRGTQLHTMVAMEM